MTRTPTPRDSAKTNPSPSPPRTRTLVRRLSSAYASTSSPLRAAATAATPSSPRSAASGIGSPDGHLRDPKGGAAVRYRHALSLLAAHAVAHLVVVGHRVDG